MAGYGPVLSAVHDAGFGFLAEAAAAELLARLDGAGHRSGLVVDLGCGSGILAGRLTAAGYDVLGVDISPGMLEIARRRVPGARFVEGSFIDMEIPRCVAVTAIGEVLGYAMDPRAGADALGTLFARTAAALQPGGVLLCDLAGPGRSGAEPVPRWSEGDGWVCCAVASEDADVLERRIVAFTRSRAGWDRTDETHRLHLVRPGDVMAALAAAGLSARTLPAYGPFTFPPGWTAFAAHPMET